MSSLPGAAGCALRRSGSRAGALPRLHFDHAAAQLSEGRLRLVDHRGEHARGRAQTAVPRPARGRARLPRPGVLGLIGLVHSRAAPLGVLDRQKSWGDENERRCAQVSGGGFVISFHECWNEKGSDDGWNEGVGCLESISGKAHFHPLPRTGRLQPALARQSSLHAYSRRVLVIQENSVVWFFIPPPSHPAWLHVQARWPLLCSSASSASALVGQTPPPAQQSCPHQSSRRRAAFAAVRPSAVLTTAAAQPLSAWPGPATRQAELHRVLSVASLLCRYHGAQS